MRRWWVGSGAAVVAAVALGACALPAVPTAVGGGGSARPPAVQGAACAAPTGDERFGTADPAAVDLNPNAVRDAIGFATTNLAASVRIYRHDCLVGTSASDVDTQYVPANLWSATKGIISILVGRFFPEADAEHGAITVRELLQQRSGLTFHWANDVAAGGTDSVEYTLSLPFDHEPGTFYEYAQTTVTLLGALVERASGLDLQTFAATELFGRIGIPRARWSWARDEHAHTYGYAFLAMAPVDLARIGTLLLHGGRWGDEQLLDEAYVREMSSPSPANPGYGFLVWTNAGDWFITPSSLARRTKDRPWLGSAPRDLFGLSGMFDQYVWIIPSLDMVVVRTGFFGATTWSHQFFRILMKGVRDVQVPDPGPIPAEPIADLSEWGSLLDLDTWPGLQRPS